MRTALICFIACFVVGVGVGLAEKKLKSTAGLFYAWLLGIIALVVLGVFFYN